MIALVVIEGMALVVLTVLVGGLLRSHADILRALHQLGADIDGPGPVRPEASVALKATPPGRAATEATDLAGVNPAGDAVRVAVGGVKHDTLLAFLTTGCVACQDLWKTMASPGADIPGGARLVAVAHDPGEESLSRLRELAPSDVLVVLSSAAWEAYDVTVAPYFVYVSGPQGRVVGQGSSVSWSQVSSLVHQAHGDARIKLGPGPAPTGGRPANDAARETRADADLAAAGILPGDAQLYPTDLEVRRR